MIRLPITGTIINGPSGPLTLKLGSLLGGGAFGIVYKAHEIEGGAAFAVKFPQAAVFGAEAELAAFENEVCASREIVHPNVVRVVHIEPQPADLPPYLVMELLSAGTLREFLNELRSAGRQLDRSRLRKWMDGVVGGITAVNEKMLHRDLRPENILLSGDTLKIADFGLSKVVGALTRTKSFKGHQHILYMAPEAWRGEVDSIKLDMYAMGIVLFEMATLEYPYQLPTDPSDELGIHEAHLFAVPRSLENIRKDLPVGISQVIARLLEKRPQDRFDEWDEVSTILKRVWEGEGKKTERDEEVDKLLSETLRRHEEIARINLDAEKKRDLLRRQNDLDLFQVNKLLSAIESAITDFNTKSSLGPMRMSLDPMWGQPWEDISADQRRAFLEAQLRDPGQGTRYRMEKFGDVYSKVLTVRPPHASDIEIRLYQVKPPLNLGSDGSARVVCFIWEKSSSYYGERGPDMEKNWHNDQVPNGQSWLLVRTDENDWYGRWGLLALKNHPSVTLNWCYTPDQDSYVGYFEERDRIVDQIEKTKKRSYGYEYVLTFTSDTAAAFLRLVRRERV